MESTELATEPPTRAHPHYVLATLMAGASAIHFAMAPAHFADSALVGVAFVATAWLQAALAVALLTRPDRRWLIVGLVGNVGVLAVWLLSRTTGVPFLHGGEPEAYAFVDVTAAALEAAFVVGAAAVLTGYRSTGPSLLRPAGGIAVLATIGLTSVALAAPADEHDHAHGATEVAAPDGHDHEHVDGETAGAAAASTPHGAHHHEECTEPVTPEQQAAADDFIAASNANAAKYVDFAVAEAEGWRPITPAYSQLVHFGRLDRLADGHQLDPDHPESLIYAYGPDRTPYFLGVMYLSETSGVDDLPQPGGCLMTWHNHENLCIAEGKGMVGVVQPDGSCPGGSANVATSYMLHAWTIPMPDGPFSEVDPQAVKQAVVDTYLS